MDTNLPNDKDTLEKLYEETIEHHEAYLDKIHHAFDKRCDTIGSETKQKLAQLDQEDKEAQRPILEEQQQRLNQTLAELKYAINKSNSNAMQRLEQIQDKLENQSMDLEAELANL